jgi:DNA-binding MarR family transcriptional regulator
MIAKKRNAHGEKAPWSKLTEAQVTEIRQRYAAGGISQSALAREYGLNQPTVGEIVRREIWKHIP